MGRKVIPPQKERVVYECDFCGAETTEDFLIRLPFYGYMGGSPHGHKDYYYCGEEEHEVFALRDKLREGLQ